MKKLADFLLWVGVILSLLGLATTTGFYFSSIIHFGVSEAVHFVDVALLTLRVAVTGTFYFVTLIISVLSLGLPIDGLDKFRDSKTPDTV